MNKSQASQSKLEVSSNCKSKLPQQNYILNRKQRKRRRKKYSTQHCIRNQRKCYPYEINKIYQHPPSCILTATSVPTICTLLHCWQLGQPTDAAHRAHGHHLYASGFFSCSIPKSNLKKGCISENSVLQSPPHHSRL